MRTLHISTAAFATSNGRSAVAAVLRWDRIGEPRIVVRRLQRGDRVPPGYRALALGLWEARRAGARMVELSIDDAEVVAQVQGIEPPPAGAIGPYLQVRALLNAFRRARVRYAAAAPNQDASAAAASALRPRPPAYADLPLWAAAS